MDSHDANFPAINRALEVLRSRHGVQKRGKPSVSEESAGAHCDASNISMDSIEMAKLVLGTSGDRLVEAERVGPALPVSAPYVNLKSALSPTIVRRLYVPTLRETRQIRVRRVERLLSILARWKKYLDLRRGFLSLRDLNKEMSEVLQVSTLDTGGFSFVGLLRFLLDDDSKIARNRPEGQVLRLTIQRHGKYKIAIWFHNYMTKYRVFWRFVFLHSRTRWRQSHAHVS